METETPRSELAIGRPPPQYHNLIIFIKSICFTNTDYLVLVMGIKSQKMNTVVERLLKYLV